MKVESLQRHRDIQREEDIERHFNAMLDDNLAGNKQEAERHRERINELVSERRTHSD